MEVKKLFTFSGHNGPVYALAEGQSDDNFMSCSGDKYVVEWNSRTGMQEKFAVKLEQSAFAVMLIRDHQLLLAGNAFGGMHVIDLVEKKELRYFTQHTGGIFDFAFSQKHQLLMAAGGDGLLTVWQLPAFDLLRTLKLDNGKLRKLALNENKNMLAIACGSGVIRIVETNFFNELHTWAGHADGATSVAWHPTKEVLLSGGKDGHIRSWNALDNFKEILSLPAHYSAIYALRFSPDGRWLASTGRDKTIKLWNSQTLDPLLRIEHRDGGHSHSVNDLHWLNAADFVSCSDDRLVQLFRVG